MPYRKKDRRGHKRQTVTGIYGNVLYPSDLDILNVSIDGAAVETTKRLDLNRDYTFKFKYKDDILNLRGRVVWSLLTYREGKSSGKVIPIYRAGVRFIDTLNEKTQILLNFIEEKKIKTFEKRLAGVRFKVAASQNVKIDYPYKCEVKRISLSGMEVETGYALALNVHYNIELFLSVNVLNIVGKVASCEKIESGDNIMYSIGVEFIEMSEKDRDLLKGFISRLEET